MEVTAPSRVAGVSAGHRRAGISYRPKTRTPNTSKAEQTGDGGADRRRPPPAPRGKPRIITVDEGKHRPTQCSSRLMAAKQGQTLQGGALSRASGAVAWACHLHHVAANHGRRRAGPQPPSPGSAGAQPSSRGRTPKGSHRPRARHARSRGPTLWIWGRRRETLGPEKHSSVSLVEPHARGGRPPGSEVPPPPDTPGLCPAWSTGGGSFIFRYMNFYCLVAACSSWIFKASFLRIHARTLTSGQKCTSCFGPSSGRTHLIYAHFIFVSTLAILYIYCLLG
ncbi:uncharacterized protein LOC123401136 [Hordeum vulgare subsp. vulgare]|uniref:Predicted protein n=1 Tax=Hordeum vulgare subsp. vulgare TaxID=112509 RepID=F2CPY7_HORVV|nr:uncharacterized protein LOC123401136 [Hordeum vulgare subsp. vulgare]BAJ84908.1 predicted protein [Hordeum vulgare subsp. vulgare]